MVDMENKKYEVKIYYTGFYTYEVVAESEEEAILKARELPLNWNEIATTLENWKEADNAEEILNGEV
ncbi:MAG: hypothetical protein QXO70_03735 [Candidatus Pacearchaeota archaeon]